MSAIPQGAIRFNTDSQKLEFYAQDQWWEMVIDSPNLGTSSDTTAGARGLFAGGNVVPAYVNTIDYINISSTGNALDFGDTTGSEASFAGSCASSIRGLIGGYYFSPASTNNIDFVTISSTGNAQDFGDLNTQQHGRGCTSNSTRGLWIGGTVNNAIDYVTISSTGNAQDFGDTNTSEIRRDCSALSSPTRGVFASGWISPSGLRNNIDYITISTLGNAQDFGDLTLTRSGAGACSNSVRGVFAGGNAGGIYVSDIDYITISTTGNSANFGDLTVTKWRVPSASSPVRGVFGGSTGNNNPIDYITFATQGNAVEFGNMFQARSELCDAGFSNAHGGL